MKKTFLSSFLIASFTGYVIFQRALGFGAQETYVAPSVQVSTTTVTIPNSQPVVGNNPPVNAGDGFVKNGDDEGSDDDYPTKPSSVQNPTPVTVAPKPVSNPVPSPVGNAGLYKNGTYTGPVTDAYYGNVQVQATISGGKISAIKFLDYPQDRSNSVRINTRAMPILISEAISAQSANVNAVSGATATSGAFVKSLASALSQAKN